MTTITDSTTNKHSEITNLFIAITLLFLIIFETTYEVSEHLHPSALRHISLSIAYGAKEICQVLGKQCWGNNYMPMAKDGDRKKKLNRISPPICRFIDYDSKDSALSGHYEVFVIGRREGGQENFYRLLKFASQSLII